MDFSSRFGCFFAFSGTFLWGEGREKAVAGMEGDEPTFPGLRTAIGSIAVRREGKLGSPSIFLSPLPDTHNPHLPDTSASSLPLIAPYHLLPHNQDRGVSAPRLDRSRCGRRGNSVAGGFSGERGAGLDKCLSFRWRIRTVFAVSSCSVRGCGEKGANRGRGGVKFEPKKRGVRTEIGVFPVRVWGKHGAETTETRLRAIFFFSLPDTHNPHPPDTVAPSLPLTAPRHLPPKNHTSPLLKPPLSTF